MFSHESSVGDEPYYYIIMSLVFLRCFIAEQQSASHDLDWVMYPQPETTRND